jgi:hypothetical protein
MTFVEDRRAITGGVDTHADTHVAAALDPIGDCSECRSSRPRQPGTAACSAGWAGSGPSSCSRSMPHCIGGQADAANQRITDALGTERESGPGGKEDDDSEQAS